MSKTGKSTKVLADSWDCACGYRNIPSWMSFCSSCNADRKTGDRKWSGPSIMDFRPGGEVPRLADSWQSMKSAPKDATRVEVKLSDGKIMCAHFAHDLSGEDQPAFSGWFVDAGSYMRGIDDPVAWRPCPPTRKASHESA